MNLIAIIAATLVSGIGSVWLAALLMRVGVRNGAGGVNPQHLLSLAAGALLATAFMHLLPEAFENNIEPAVLFAVLLFGLVFSSCWTRPSCGTTDMNTGRGRQVKRRMVMVMVMVTRAVMGTITGRCRAARVAGRC